MGAQEVLHELRGLYGCAPEMQYGSRRVWVGGIGREGCLGVPKKCCVNRGRFSGWYRSSRVYGAMGAYEVPPDKVGHVGR